MFPASWGALVNSEENVGGHIFLPGSVLKGQSCDSPPRCFLWSWPTPAFTPLCKAKLFLSGIVHRKLNQYFCASTKCLLSTGLGIEHWLGNYTVCHVYKHPAATNLWVYSNVRFGRYFSCFSLPALNHWAGGEVRPDFALEPHSSCVSGPGSFITHRYGFGQVSQGSKLEEVSSHCKFFSSPSHSKGCFWRSPSAVENLR